MPYKIPDHFYYQKEKSKKKYHANPPGVLAVSRMAQGLNAWQDFTDTKVNTPKNLVLNDWAVSLWKEDSLYLDVLLQLVTSTPPFKVFVILDGAPLEITKDNLILLKDKEVHKKIKPIPEKDISHIMSLCDIPKTSVLSLDRHELDMLILGRPIPTFLNVDEIMRVGCSVVDIINYYQHKPVTLEVGSLTARHLILFNKLSKVLKHSKQRQNITQLRIDKDNANSFKGAPSTYPIPIGNITDFKLDIETERGFELDHKSLFHLLSGMSNLKSLSLKRLSKSFMSQAILEKQSSEAFRLFFLEEIDVSRSGLSFDEINELITCNPLKKLNARGCHALTSGQNELDASRYKALTDLTLSSTDITPSILHTMLKENYALKHLELRATELSSLSSTKPFNLPHLTSLNVFLSKVLPEGLLRLLNNTFNLKELAIDSGILPHLDKEMIERLKPHLQSVACLKLDEESDATIESHSEAFHLLLSTCPTLKKVDLYTRSSLNYKALKTSCPTLRELEINGKSSLEYHPPARVAEVEGLAIETLTFSMTTFEENAFNALFQKPEHIKSLRLAYCESKDAFTMNATRLPNLESLTIERENKKHLGEQAIAHLIKLAPNLKTLSLRNEEVIKLPLLQHPLEKLSSLSLEKVNINLFELLLHCPKLSSLKLSFFESRPIDVKQLETHTLPFLKTMELSHSSIGYDGLETIFKIAPQLNTLTLDMLSNLNLSSYHFKTPCHTLRTLHLCGLVLEPQPFLSLLSHVPNIEELNINDTEIDDAFETTDFPTLTHLRKLSLGKVTISLKLLKTLILKAPHLEHIQIPTSIRLDSELSKLLETRGIELIRPIYNTPPLKTTGDAPTKHDTQSATIDSDTRLKKDQTFNVTRHFFSSDGKTHPPIQYERHTSFDTLTMNSAPAGSSAAFNVSASPLTPSDLTLVDAIKPMANLLQTAQKQATMKSDAPHFIGVKKLMLNRSWQALPSLSSNEKMIGFETDTDNTEIAYSEKSNLYFVRSKVDVEPCEFKWLVECPQTKPHPLPKSVKALVDFCSDFSSGNLKMQPGPHTGEEYIEALIEQRLGTCRHRAVVFKYLMAKKHPEIPVRIITNDCHAFVEIQYKGHWRQQCLGGYPATLKIDESNHPDSLKAKSAPVTESLSEAGVSHSLDKYRAHFDPMKKKARGFQSAASLIQALLKSRKNKTLLNLGVDCIPTLEAALLKAAHDAKRPIFIVNHPDDLICSAPFIKSKEGGKGVMSEGNEQGGPLHDFLVKHTHLPPLLIVNYSAFDNEETVRANPLLDLPPTADGTPLPHGTQIIGLTDTSLPGAYDGGDFFSRFNEEIDLPFQKEDLPAPIPQPKDSDITEAFSLINLYHATDWRERLMGRWTLKGQDLIFEEGALIDALKSGKPIVLSNAPWDNPEFQLFWQTLSITRKVDGIKIPKAQAFLKRDGYHFKAYQSHIKASTYPSDIVLNPSSFLSFISTPLLDIKTKGLIQGEGLLKKHEGQSLRVTLTRALSDSEWSILLDEALKHHVTLSVHVLSGVKVPEDLGLKPMEKRVANSFSTALGPDNSLIESNDIDMTVQTLKTTNDNCFVIDISELKPEDLFGTINGRFNKVTRQFEFNNQPGVLSDERLKDKKLILKGTLTAEMTDALMPDLLKTPSTITLVTTSHPLIAALPRQSHIVTTQEKCAYLEKTYPEVVQDLPIDLIDTSPLIQLEAMLIHLNRDSMDKALGVDAWIGVETLPEKTPLLPCDIHDKHELQDTIREFKMKRIKAVQSVLEKEPFAVLTGATGVGKSSFVERHLIDKTKKLFHGEKALSAWADDKSKAKQKILFIDEANITTNSWERFEGLYEVPPFIIINGKLHELDKSHKVVFAMNPKSYGDERETPAFFKRHGNAILFEPLPLAFIYQEILLPLFEKTLLDRRHPKARDSISQTLLDAYQFFADISHEKVLITPRELKMIGMLVVSAFNKNPKADPILLTHHFLRLTTLKNVPLPQRTKFDTLFPETTDNLPKEKGKADTSFILTPTREPLNQALDDFLTLRDFRRADRIPTLNDTQAFGGLGAFVIEGEPGIGKTEIVKRKLQLMGFKKHTDKDIKESDNLVYHIPATITADKMEALLLEAFDKGAVVVVDEMSSLRSLKEGLLNALLMGKTPEGVKAKQKGFMLIGTQNPISMAGRKAMSHALQRRSFKFELPPYDAAEMEDILVHLKGLTPELSRDLIHAYLEERDNAERSHLEPVPCFRDLLNTVDEHYAPKTKKTNLKDEILTATSKFFHTGKKHLPEDTPKRQRTPRSAD